MTELVYHAIYSELSLPTRHRFPIGKYRGIQQALIDHGISASGFTRASPIDVSLLCDSFCPTYVQSLVNGELDTKAMRRIGFPWSEQLIKRSLTAVGGTLLTGQLALAHGLAINLTGGYHHAFNDYGSGFCLFNDLYLCAQSMLDKPEIDRVLIVDLDVHQGDGTAKLAEGDDRIITLSIHCEKNFPYRKQQSDMDFALAKNTGDHEYLDTLRIALSMALDYYRPDAVIYDAGVDIHQDDDLGLFDVTTEGIYQRDKWVIDTCQKKGLPLACVIGGGYQRNTADLVEIHLQLFKAAQLFC